MCMFLAFSDGSSRFRFLFSRLICFLAFCLPSTNVHVRDKVPAGVYPPKNNLSLAPPGGLGQASKSSLKKRGRRRVVENERKKDFESSLGSLFAPSIAEGKPKAALSIPHHPRSSLWIKRGDTEPRKIPRTAEMSHPPPFCPEQI